MPRSKNLHVINFTREVTQPNDPTDIAVNAQIDMALELSKQLGRNIRQGQQFRLVGYGAFPSKLTVSTSDVDTGMSLPAFRLGYAPSYKHSVNAWNMMFKILRSEATLLISGSDDMSVTMTLEALCYKAAPPIPPVPALLVCRWSRRYQPPEYGVSVYDNSSSGVSHQHCRPV